MLDRTQIGRLLLLAVAFWAAATLWIRLVPSAFTDPVQRAAGLAAAFPIGWLCVRLARRSARLTTAQLVPATALVVAAATLIDGAVLQWAPDLYAPSDAVRRVAAAWLLWGYGAALLVAFILAARATHVQSRIQEPVRRNSPA